MKKYFILSALLLAAFFASCVDDEYTGGDVEKVVEMTIYPETGYGASILSDIWMQPLLFSDSDDPQQQMVLDIEIDGLDFEYERGYEYKLRVKKIWMQNPPQDASRIRYEFIEMISQKKVIVNDKEEILELTVYPSKVKFIPTNPIEYEADGVTHKMYDALLVKNNATGEGMALVEIEGFNFQKGYEYVIDVRKHTKANPYKVSYELLKVVSKEVAKP